MRIGQLALQTGVSASRIRFYEAEGLLAPAERRANGYREYGPRDAKMIAFIERTQRLGFSLKDIAAFLAGVSQTKPTAETLIGHLKAKLIEIDAHIDDAQKRRGEVIALIEELGARDGL